MAQAGAADGFNITPVILPHGIDEFVELVLPELRRRGLFRDEYEGGPCVRTLASRPGEPLRDREVRRKGLSQAARLCGTFTCT